MSEIRFPDPAAWGGVTLVDDLGVLMATGADAASFLHGQLSQDMLGHGGDELRLAAYCSAKGRMLATFHTLRPAADTFWLLTDRSVLPGVVKRLSMFVLRSKAKLTDESASFKVLGVVGPAAAETLGVPTVLQVGHAASCAGGMVGRLRDAQGCPRWYWVGPSEAADAVLTTLPALPVEAWSWLDVMSNVPRVTAATADQFVPQMVNFELIDGVNFKKGCYPGQEVVARSQYRGTTKRRAFLLRAAAAVQPGIEVYSMNEPAQPAGMVVNVARIPGAQPEAGACVAIVELKLTATGEALRAGSADGIPLEIVPQPYPLPSPD